MTDKKFSTVDDYIKTFPADTQVLLENIRQTIHKVVPSGIEKISYGIPAVNVDGRYLIYFSGWKDHVSLYPIPRDAAVQDLIEPYKAGKGTIRFSLTEPMPYEVVARVTQALLDDRTAAK